MLTLATIGVLSSLATEIVTWLNKKFAGTVFQGDGAFALSGVIAVIASAIEVATTGGFTAWTFSGMYVYAGSVWATSQVFYAVIMRQLNLTVQN